MRIMIRFLRVLFGWTEFDFSAMESRARARFDMQHLYWNRKQRRWVDGYSDIE